MVYTLWVQAVSQVAVGPRLLDFGKVSAASRNVRYLAVTNPLLHSIHVVLALAHLPELNHTEPVGQVLKLELRLCPQSIVLGLINQSEQV